MTLITAILFLALAPSVAHATVVPRHANGPVFRFVLPGMQVDPVIADGHVVYRSVEEGFPHATNPPKGVNMWLDTIPLSLSTRIGIYDGGVTEGLFAEIDNGVIVYNLPDSSPTTQEFAGKLNFLQIGVSPGNKTAVNDTLMKAKSDVHYSGQTIVDAKFAWMQLGPAGDWDVWWQHGADWVITDKRNLGVPGTNERDPSVGRDCVAWTEEVDRTQFLTKVECITSGISLNIGPGRHPQVVDNFWGRSGTVVIYESRDSPRSMIGLRPVSGGSNGVLPGLPGRGEQACASFSRPKVAADGQFVVYRGESCGVDDESWLLLTVATPISPICTIIVSKDGLPRWMNDDNPPQYDVDEHGVVVFTRMIDSGQNAAVPETDLFYYLFDPAVERCQ